MSQLLHRDSKNRTQANAIAHHNDNKEVMLAVCDIPNLDQESLSEIKKDWRLWNWQVTSTRIDYGKNTITHHADSNQTKPTIIKLKSIPYCWPTYLNELVSTKDGLDFAKAILGNMKLTKSKLISEYERISGKSADYIRFWTPSNESRKARPLRAVRLYFSVFVFSVVADGWVDGGSGVSRGVRVSSAKQNEPEAKK